MALYELLNYDEWATTQLLTAMEALSPEQFQKELSGRLTSVRQQCVHYLSVSDRYRARLEGEKVPDVAPEDFETVREIQVYASETIRRRREYFATLTENDLVRNHEHLTRQGSFTATVEQTLAHVLNHSTYHRGQIAMLIKQQGMDFPDTDYILWLNQNVP